jgi:peroxiredoxin
MASLQPKLPAVTLLSDVGLATSIAWDLHAPGAENPNPGTFVVDRDGTVRWRRLADSRGDWPTYAEVAAALH